jgi:hypothetical protein
MDAERHARGFVATMVLAKGAALHEAQAGIIVGPL